MSQPASELRSDTLAPHSVEAEEAVLGSVMINPGMLPLVSSYITEQDFFIVRHGWIFGAVLALAHRAEPIDYLTVMSEVERSGRLAEAGGAAYLLSLVNRTPSALNVEGYAAIVQRMALRRRLIAAAQDVAKAAHHDDLEIPEMVGQAESAIMRAVKSARIRGALTGRELADRHWSRREAVMRGEETFSGIASGLVDLDATLGGIKGGDLLLVAARPGVGKTSLLLTLARNMVCAGYCVGIMSYEMSADSLTTRLHSMNTGISYRVLDGGRFDQRQMESYVKSTSEIAGWRLLIEDDVSDKSIQAARMKARGMALEHGLDILFVDYVQLMTAPGRENRVQEIGEISRGLKAIARELNIPVVAASQLSRAVESRADKRALLSDLRESGDLEQDADVVIFPYRDSYYNADTPEGNRTELQIAKHRNGPTGTVDVIWRPETMTFVNATRSTIDLDNYQPQPTQAALSAPGR